MFAHGSAAKAIALGIAVAMLSLPALGNTRRQPAPPQTPGNFHVAATTDNSITFAWNASAPGPGGTPVYGITNDTTGFLDDVYNATSYTWTVGVQAGFTYSFHINAILGTQESAPSPELTVTLPGAPPPPPAIQPAAPVITQTSVTSGTITVTWTESTPASEISACILLVNGTQNGGGASPSSTTATATGLAASTAFAVSVECYSQNGETGALSATSAPVTVTTAAGTPPSPNAPTAPTGLTGSGDGGGEAIISWNPSTSANEPQADIQYDIYINGVLDINDSTVGQTLDIYIFPRGATLPAQVYVVAVDQFGNTSAPSNVLTLSGF